MIGWDRVACFGDEAATALEDQLLCMLGQDIRWLELRNAWGGSVAALDGERRARARRLLAVAGIGVASIGSPVGKSALHEGWEPAAATLRRCLAAAEELEAPLVRVFSFYVPPGGHDAARAQVTDWMGRMAAVAAAHGITLVHENEKGIYGDTPERCASLLAEVGSPSLRACFDVANFVQVGVRDVRAAWALLEPVVAHIHVKDALADGSVVPAGEGVGDWPFILARLRSLGYAGFLSLEPHLDEAVEGSGCHRLGVAAGALRRLLGDGGAMPVTSAS